MNATKKFHCNLKALQFISAELGRVNPVKHIYMYKLAMLPDAVICQPSGPDLLNRSASLSKIHNIDLSGTLRLVAR